MPTVAHGLKDGVDQILEQANALQNMLQALLADLPDHDSVDATEATRARASLLSAAITQLTTVKADTSSARSTIDRILKSS